MDVRVSAEKEFIKVQLDKPWEKNHKNKEHTSTYIAKTTFDKPIANNKVLNSEHAF